ncbi:MAG TPA: thioesterase family protein [Bryobacteraceae bacterium]|nr:thioesterase family protein [Bryobacteraceae bacterium]
MPGNPFVYQSRVRFGDTDASGRIFYVSLLNHFDAAESEFMRSLGISYTVDQNPNLAFPRVHVECDYTSALVYDDLMDIAVSVDRVGGASFTLAFEVTVDSRNAARGKVVIACIDRRTQRAVPLPEKLREALIR